MTHRAWRLLAPLAFSILVASCGQAPDAAAPACHAETFEGARFHDCVVSPQDSELRIVVDGKDGKPLRSFNALKAALGRDASRIRFAVNAGMFDEDGDPIGLFITGGDPVAALNRNPGPGNFHMLPNGVFSVESDGYHIRTSDRYAAATAARPLYATQSGPMLVIDGALHPRVAPDGTSLNIRNGVGIDGSGRAHFAISDDPVSFGKLARFLRDAKGCKDALFLDGTISSLWDPAADRVDADYPLGPMVVALTPER